MVVLCARNDAAHQRTGALAMTLKELMKELRAIIKVHPEAKEADVVCCPSDETGLVFHVHYIGYDKRHRHSRIKFEDM